MSFAYITGIYLFLQAFSLADEKEETTPEEGLLAMSLLKHQVIDTL
jgi:hypothetical protein